MLTRSRIPQVLGLAFALFGGACSSSSPSPATPPAADTSQSVATETATVPIATPAPADPRVTWPDWPRTDFTRSTIDLAEVTRGCPSRGCIPALDAPGAVSASGGPFGVARFDTVTAVDYPAQYPVAVLQVGEVARGYPLHILTWHEIINDMVEGTPVAVTFCPLCNTAIAFDRRVDGTTLDFAVSGNLRNSDLVMWDRQTESWWQQATGEGIAGEHAGVRLETLSLSVVSFGDFAKQYPDALVLTENTGLSRDYGLNPYDGYDTLGIRPFLFDGRIDPRLEGLERVAGLGRGGTDFVAVPFGSLSKARVAHVEVESVPVVVFWASGTVSVLGDSSIERAADIGAATAFARTAAGRVLTFEAESNGQFRDTSTGSTWNIFGHATDGPLQGEQLTPVVHTTEFWFAWAAFRPGTKIWTGD